MFIKIINRVASVMLCITLAAVIAAAQTGGVKGKVRDAQGKGVAGASVLVRQGEREIAQGTTNGKGEFLVTNVPTGTYTVTIRKPGLRVGSVAGVEIKNGKTISLRDRLVLPIDDATLAFLRGSVFNEAGRSVANVQVEIARIAADGTARKFDARLTNETGQFVFRLSPDAAKYRLTVKPNGAAEQSQDINVEGAMIYRVVPFTLRAKSSDASRAEN